MQVDREETDGGEHEAALGCHGQKPQGNLTSSQVVKNLKVPETRNPKPATRNPLLLKLTEFPLFL